MTKRFLIAVLVVTATLVFPAGHASAAANPFHLPIYPIAPTRGDYGELIATCTRTSATSQTCGLVFAASPTISNWGQPTQAIFGCLTSSPQGQQIAFVVSSFFINFLGSGSVFGTAGVNSFSPPHATAASFLFGWSNTNYAFLGGGVGFDSGQTAGFASVNNSSGQVDAGDIGISVSGAVLTYNAATRRTTMNQGGLACNIQPANGTTTNTIIAQAFPGT